MVTLSQQHLGQLLELLTQHFLSQREYGFLSRHHEIFSNLGELLDLISQKEESPLALQKLFPDKQRTPQEEDWVKKSRFKLDYDIKELMKRSGLNKAHVLTLVKFFGRRPMKITQIILDAQNNPDIRDAIERVINGRTGAYAIYRAAGVKKDPKPKKRHFAP